MKSQANAAAVLNTLYHKKSRSLAAYIVQANPYVAEGNEWMLEAVKEVAEADAALTDELSEMIISLEAVPSAGPYDAALGELNYLAIDYLVGVLAGELEKQWGEFEAAREALAQFPEALALLSRVQQAAKDGIAKLAPKDSA